MQTWRASWRASSAARSTIGWDNPIDQPLPRTQLGIKESQNELLKRNCLPPEAGQVYPLIGRYVASSEDRGAVTAVRRMLEWTSWEKWPERIRTNPFNDFEQRNLYRDDRGRYVIERRLWQGQWRRYYAVPWGPYYIWGATARILRGLAERVAE